MKNFVSLEGLSVGVLSLSGITVRKVCVQLNPLAFLVGCIVTTFYSDLYIHTEEYGKRLGCFNFLQCVVFGVNMIIGTLSPQGTITSMLLAIMMSSARLILFGGNNMTAIVVPHK